MNINPDPVDPHKNGNMDELKTPAHLGGPQHVSGTTQQGSGSAQPERVEDSRPAMLDTEDDMAHATTELFAEPLISPVKDMETNVFFS